MRVALAAAASTPVVVAARTANRPSLVVAISIVGQMRRLPGVGFRV